MSWRTFGRVHAALPTPGGPWEAWLPQVASNTVSRAAACLTFGRQLASTSTPGQVDDVQAAQQELDDFFGTGHLQSSPSGAPTGGGVSQPPWDSLTRLQGSVATPSSASLRSLHEARATASTGLAVEYGDPEQLGQASIPAAGCKPAVHARALSTASDQHDGDASRLTHVDHMGRASMVDVGAKPDSVRVAGASARVLLGASAFDLVARNQVAKGDVLTTAQLAGIMAAKHTSLLVPLCHNIALSRVDVRLRLDPERCAVHVVSEARTVGKTGVEMEALTAATVAALTVYDMCKAASKEIVITDVQLDFKSGGKSADYDRRRPALE